MTLRRFNRVLVLAVMLIFTNKVDIQADGDIIFKNIGIEDGLAQSTVERIFQDSKGYIWIATHDGLNRYNGNEFRTYKFGKDETKTLSSSSITDMIEDKNGDMWIGTSNGLNKIDTKTDDIKRYMDKGNGGSLSNFNITDLMFTRDGRFLVATSDGLNIYNEKLDTFERILQNDYDLTDQFIYSIDEDDKGDIWIATKSGLDEVSKDFKVLKSFANDSENSISSSAVYNLEYDNRGYMWIGTSESGLVRINLKTYDIKRYRYDRGDSSSVGADKIREIYKDKQGYLWVGTENGLSKYDYDEDNFDTYTSNEKDKDRLMHNRINDIYQDKEGLIWVGTYLGISIFDPNNKIQHYRADKADINSLNFNSIHGIYEDDEGLLWVGTDSRGINIIDRKNNIINHIDESSDKLILSDYKIKDITGKGEYIYIATKDGLNIIDKKLNTIKVYKIEDGLKSNVITSLHLDSKGYLWIGSSDGLNIMNTKDNSIIDITSVIKNGSSVIPYVNDIYEDREGNYYVGLLRNEGLIKLNTKDKTISQYKNDKNNDKSISNNYIRSIIEDTYGNIWVGTSYGLNKFDKDKEEFTTYTMENGLCNDTVYGILIDNSNNLWLSTNGGISKFDTKNKKFQSLSVIDGLQSNEFNGNAYYKTKSGELVFGGVNGLNILDPKQIEAKDYKPDIVFERFEINGEKYTKLDNETLNHDKNTIKIKYFIPKYSNPEKLSYYYKLEGIDTNWHYTTNSDVVFHELAPGDYTFRIVPKYSNGEYGQDESIKFHIKAPFWMSKPAIFMYILLMILFIYRMINKTKRLDRLVKSKTKQLVKEMDAKSKLLNKIIKLEQNKNKYFVNLSHELRTPLNVINSTNQLICGLSKSGKEMDNDKLGYYMEISNKNCKRLLNLINNIIDSSKLQSDNYIINFKEENIVNVVEEAALSLAEYAKSKKIDLIIDPKVEEVYLKCDAYEIERCIVNLVSNAIKFTPEDGIIEVDVELKNDEAIISVADSGMGIDKKYQKAIFDRFSQVIESNIEAKGGSGLGLTITKQIIELHHGTIYVESEANKGSKFIIILPIYTK